MRRGFAIYPDGAKRPSAVFDDLADALSWALEKYGSNRFAIRDFPYLPLEARAAEGA